MAWQEEMMAKEQPSGVVYSFGENYLRSPLFARFFADGMKLIEEVAAYLDGEGRKDAAALDRSELIRYTEASMKLTTLLMQVASWLLITRAFREGEYTQERFESERQKLRELKDVELDPEHQPEQLVEFVRRANTFVSRIIALTSKAPI